jgi:hypothetical protein
MLIALNGFAQQGYLSRAEAQQALDGARDAVLHPAPVATVAPSMPFAAACDRYLREKSRKRSLAEDGRILKAAFGGQTPLAAITASTISDYRGRRLAATSCRGST